MSEFLIHSPYHGHVTGQGNSVTALRLESMLVTSGYQVHHSQGDYSGMGADVMVALNARKSAKAIARFRYLHPHSGLVIILTGTDINHPDVIDESSATWISMKLADRLILLHAASLQQVPKKFRKKTQVIYPSVELPEQLTHKIYDSDEFSIVMAGNLRKEKNFELAFAAGARISAGLKMHHYGECNNHRSEHVVAHGVVSHDVILEAMSKAHILLNTSLQEGGANAVCEAISMGLPVVASAIPGNVGILGDDYEGTFPSGDVDALVSLLEKVARDADFYALLKRQVVERASLFSYRRELTSWLDLLDGLLSK